MANSIKMTAGHSKADPGAVGYIVERDEARKVVSRVAEIMNANGVKNEYYFDNTTTTVNANLANLVNWHNRTSRTLDMQVHFNSSGGKTQRAIGVEVYVHNKHNVPMAAEMSAEIAKALGLPNRGAKIQPNFYFLYHTSAPAMLVEVCFVNSQADVDSYRKNFEPLCQAIAKVGAKYSGQPMKPSTTPQVTVKPKTKGTFRLSSGLFKNAEDLAEGKKKVRKYYPKMVIYEKPEDVGFDPGYRIVTGTFGYKEDAETAATLFKEKYGWTMYVHDETKK